ncbi:MAG: hypothetical protein LE168_00620 [Endomicrobium sp.]|nr:hypothetical protein [Endomicrobium sp.]
MPANSDKIITTSIFDLFKTGPGPSSSHTIGPIKAGVDFSRRIKMLDCSILAQAEGLRVRLFVSLSATGKGHGTDRAVIAGLMDNDPSTCPPTLLNDLLNIPQEKCVLDLGGKKINIGLKNIEYGAVNHNFPYNNTLIIYLLSEEYSFSNEKVVTLQDSIDPLEKYILFSWEYYSIGGGFLQWKNWTAPRIVMPPHPYNNMAELLLQIKEKDLHLHRLLIQNEMAISGLSEEKINAKLGSIINMMKDTAARGVAVEGTLPGHIGSKKKSKKIKRTRRFSRNI